MANADSDARRNTTLLNSGCQLAIFTKIFSSRTCSTAHNTAQHNSQYTNTHGNGTAHGGLRLNVFLFLLVACETRTGDCECCSRVGDVVQTSQGAPLALLVATLVSKCARGLDCCRPPRQGGLTRRTLAFEDKARSRHVCGQAC